MNCQPWACVVCWRCVVPTLRHLFTLRYSSAWACYYQMIRWAVQHSLIATSPTPHVPHHSSQALVTPPPPFDISPFLSCPPWCCMCVCPLFWGRPPITWWKYTTQPHVGEPTTMTGMVSRGTTHLAALHPLYQTFGPGVGKLKCCCT